ncbi:UDP-N-acetylglucosamine-N-acetylmuramylpentapeptide N-acetylglucosamine transferase [Thermosyntropha lipolytica DSM 11003]|uniref:UDP-N-acetylglucosamine--N-acetylmuramyl-(pentapeptide) pyrophosphoryl-undecaprenol N-acetylglucosamine transferase n=1 Tax=Thermosyntropha lipolytica DSM 11003 TaxID=1123382 RepID=A0A1M5NY68_9FIRM|nr:undecaprenyldiphospho-muramoylpentapeptide beta-N-acetylglucosaminyltransferase [Thermosyntropha lipolytica]SHG94428.1 UDP-N-acetylglucosamine-N-acetylmuramylpentapeptide N-acetylglucosamine transferase [Thermosyntropha lipolytica DSM 11003]
MRLIVSGGGTGGHIYPALAIAKEVKRIIPEAQILYVGTEKGMEKDIVSKEGYPFYAVDISGIDRSSLLRASRSLLKVPKSFWQAFNIIKEFKPDVVLGTGGYVSFPVVLAGTFFNCKTMIHEQNVFPGLANRKLASRVDCIFLTFEETRKYLSGKKIKVTGLPVRREIMEVKREEALKHLELKDKFTLIAFGGSRGAMSINKAMLEVVRRYQNNEDMQIIWITGYTGYEEIKEKLAMSIDTGKMKLTLRLFPYMYNIEEALAVSSLAVCRAGASTLCELAVLGLPAILIPYPYAAEGHQEKNARALKEKKAADMVIDEYLDGDTLYNKIEYLRNNPYLLAEMRANLLKEARPYALKDIVETIING